MAEKRNVFNKAKIVVGDFGTKMEKSINEIKDQAVPVADKVIKEVKKQS